MKKISLFFCLFLYILGPILDTPLGLYADPILLLSLVLLAYGCIKKWFYIENAYSVFKYFKYPLILFQLYLFLPLYFCLLFPEYGTHFFSELIKPLRILLTLCGGFVLVIFYRRLYGHMFFFYMLKHIVYVMLINSVIMVMQTFNPLFRDFISDVFYRIEDGVNRYGLEFRSSGLYLSGGALPSAIQTLVTIFIPLLIRKNIFNIYEGLLFVFILFSTSILTGRTGIFASVLYFFLSFSIFTKKQRFKELVVLFFLFILLISFLSLSFLDDNMAFTHVIERFATLEGYLDKTSQNSDPTFEVLLGKWSLPHNIFIFFFGTLGFSNIIYTHVSDMGFNISLWRYGIIGTCLFYYPFFKFFNMIVKMKSPFLNNERLTVAYFLLTYIMFECKENMMYARNGLSILSLVICGYIIYRNMLIADAHRTLIV